MKTTKLTLVERTILANQYKILSNYGDKSTNLANVEILESGYTGLYHQVLLTDEEIAPEICKETSDILQMYRVINNAFAALPADQQATLDMERIKFEGFDQHESHFHYASFMIDTLDLWKEHKEMYLNSHTGSSIVKYKSMLEVYNRHYGKPDYNLSGETIQEIISAV